MKKIVFFQHTGYCGESSAYLEEVSDNITAEELDVMAWEAAVDHAQSYGRELCTDECDDDDCDMEHPGSTNIEGNWAIYNPDEHDCIL